MTSERDDWSEDESQLCLHAKRELELAGLFNPDSDYEGMLGQAAYEIVKVFARQGHSGASAEMTTDIVTRLMRFEPLTPITSDPDDWVDHGDMGGEHLWQNRRDGRLFSTDGGKTWYSVA